MPVTRPAAVGDSVDRIDTPALVLDMDAFERNLARMAESVRAAGVALRPHAKSHKCAEIAKRQIALGAVGVCCQKVSEAEALVDEGIGDVLVTNEVIGAAKLDRLARLALRASLGVLVDDAGNIGEIEAAAGRAGAVIDALVELDIGAGRCGVLPGDPAVDLARRISASRHLRFRGLHAYQGAAQHLRSVQERHSAIDGAAAQVARTREMIEAAGIHCTTVTGAGTGTFPLEAASGVWTELQPGSYVFMDADYRRNRYDARWPPFEQSLFVLTCVMSRPSSNRAIVDAGLKASSVDSGMPQVLGRPGIEYAKASDEHGVIKIARGTIPPALGEKLLLIPGHCDPTVNLHDWLVCVRRDRVEALWPITARGALW